MAAEVHFGGGREPAQLVFIAAADEEGGFGEVVLGGDGLHDRIGQEILERDHRGGIAFKNPAREGVHLVGREFGHDSTVAGAGAAMQELRTGKA